MVVVVPEIEVSATTGLIITPVESVPSGGLITVLLTVFFASAGGVGGVSGGSILPSSLFKNAFPRSERSLIFSLSSEVTTTEVSTAGIVLLLSLACAIFLP